MSKIIKTETIDKYTINTYDNGTTVKYLTPTETIEHSEPSIPQPTEQELFQAETLLNQMEIINTQTAQDEVLAELLLNNLEV